MSESPFLVTQVTIPPHSICHDSPFIREHVPGHECPLDPARCGCGVRQNDSARLLGHSDPRQVAWLTLDEQDNDPIRFWISVLLALRATTPALGEAALALLTETAAPALSAALPSLLNDLATRAEETTLILGDYQVVEEPSIHLSLAFVLQHAPSCLHLVLSSREDPPLPLSRLRAGGQVVEIRETDLRVDVHEAETFLTHTMGLRLPKDAVQELWQRTEGWLVGLQLAALSLYSHAESGAFVQHFSGSSRYVLDYVQDEILGRVPLVTQRFLLQTAILSSLCADLCQAVTGEPASQQLLEGLERANLFVMPLDTERHWYRMHSLIRTSLLARMQATEPEQMSLLHSRAAVWYAGHRLLREAIPHAFAAHESAYAAELIEQFVVPQSWHNEYHTLHRWLSRLSHEVLRIHPGLSFLAAQSLILTTQSGPGAWQQAHEQLRDAEQGYREVGNQAGLGAVLTARAVVTGFQGEFLDAFMQAQAALTLLPSEDRQWRGLCLCILGIEAVLSGPHATAVSLLQQALVLCGASGLLPTSQLATLMLGHYSCT